MTVGAVRIGAFSRISTVLFKTPLRKFGMAVAGLALIGGFYGAIDGWLNPPRIDSSATIDLETGLAKVDLTITNGSFGRKMLEIKASPECGKIVKQQVGKESAVVTLDLGKYLLNEQFQACNMKVNGLEGLRPLELEDNQGGK